MKEKTRSTDLMCAHVLAGSAFAKDAEIAQKVSRLLVPNPGALGSNPAGPPVSPRIKN